MSMPPSTDNLKNNIVYLFIGIWICALIGFHRTYTVFFPEFNGFQWEQHFHGAVLMSWFAMLIVQPFLIKFRKYKVHRTLGKIGYVLAPLVCFSIYLVTKMLYMREITTRPENEALASMAISVPSIFFFALFFCLAMINRRVTYVHMRYMIGTAVLMIGPGLGRILIVLVNLPFPEAVSITLFVMDAVPLVLLLNDARRKTNIKPMLIIAICLLINHVVWIYQESVVWQTFAKWFAIFTF